MTTRTNTNPVLETHNVFFQTQGPQGREVPVRGRRLRQATGHTAHAHMLARGRECRPGAPRVWQPWGGFRSGARPSRRDSLWTLLLTGEGLRRGLPRHRPGSASSCRRGEARQTWPGSRCCQWMAAAAAPGGSPPVASASGAGGAPARKAAGGARPRAQLHTSGFREVPTWARARLLTSRWRWGWGALRLCSTPDGPPLLHGHWFVECGLRPFGSATSRIFPGSESHLQTFDLAWPSVSTTTAGGHVAHRPHSRSWSCEHCSGLGASCLSGCQSLRCIDSCPVCLFITLYGWWRGYQNCSL